MGKLSLTLLFFAVTGLWAEAPLTGVVVGSSPFQPGRYRAPVPRYSGGRILAINPDMASFTLWSGNGEPGPSVTLAPADFGASGVRIVALAAASAGGRLAASVSFTAKEGASASGIVWMGPDGRVERVVRTSPFAARAVEFDQTGHLWAAGRVHDAAFEEERDFPVLRRYDAEGKLVLSALPKSSFASLPRSVLGEVRLAASGDHAGLLAVDGQEYVEVGPDGSVVSRRRVALPAGALVTGFALTAGGGVWLSLQHEHDSSPASIGSRTEVLGLSPAGALQPLDTANVRASGQGIKVMGASSTGLILRTTPPGNVVVLRVPRVD